MEINMVLALLPPGFVRFAGPAVITTIAFFITSSDFGLLVIDTITAGGNVDAPVTAGGPFAALLLVMIWSAYRDLMEEYRMLRNG